MKKIQDIDSSDTAILAISVSTAILYALRIRSPPSYFRTISKATATASLSLLCAINGKSWSIVTALALGAIGDALLAWPGEAAFLRGLYSFLTAHLLYTRHFLRSGGGMRLMPVTGWRQLLGAILLALAPAMGFILVPRVGPSLRMPIAVYSVVALSMALTALTVVHQRTVAGAILFAFSDCLLGADEFVLPADSKQRVWMQHAIWALYYGGQLLIASGFIYSSI